MNDIPEERPAHGPDETCPICGGSGELTYVDEEVGCRITVPCWSCQPAPAEKC
jgi:hypothetical protein